MLFSNSNGQGIVPAHNSAFSGPCMLCRDQLQHVNHSFSVLASHQRDLKLRSLSVIGTVVFNMSVVLTIAVLCPSVYTRVGTWLVERYGRTSLQAR